MQWSKEPGSFRDPSGFVFVHDGVVHRQVNAAYSPQYRQLIDSGLYAELARAALLVPHDEVALRLEGAPPAHTVLRPRQIPFISYPYEWCFGQHKAAALLTLDIQKRALEHGMVLRDASAYNVQFLDGHPIFIDTLSFGAYVDGQPWTAYRQFCQHFLNPLALMALVNPALGQLSRVHIDGVPLEVAGSLLPVSSRLRPGLLMHIHLHRRSSVTGAAQHAAMPTETRSRRMNKTAMLGLADSLARTVQALSWSPPATLWSTYTEHCNYTDTARDHKESLVAQWLDEIAARSEIAMLWDVGANTGTFSRIAAKRARSVVSFDLDHAAVEHHHRACQQRNDTRILPLIQDLANPSPAAGWHHSERRSLIERGPADAALALALVHHLAIGGNVPIDSIALFFRDVCKHLVIEFVPKEDSQVKRMLALRDDIFPDYSLERFESAFLPHFAITRHAAIEGTVRTLYLMQRRG